MKQPSRFGNAPLGDMVALGAVTSSTFRVWMRTRRPGRIVLDWRPEGDPSSPPATQEVMIPPGNRRDNTAGVTIGGREAPLAPMTAYHWRVAYADDGAPIGEGTIETAPAGAEDAPDRYAIALMSCNQPFDPDGGVNTPADRMLRATLQALRKHRTKMVLMIGDQMYADMPEPLSLFNPGHFRRLHPMAERRVLDCPVETIRRFYQERYRHFWNIPAWRAILREFPCYMIWDDHDIVDNWGSADVHRTPPWQRLFEGARRAFMDYQGGLVFENGEGLPDAFDIAIRYGPTAVFVMDIRSNRRVGPDARIYSEHQERRFEAFLEDNADAETLFLVLPVPVLHLPRILARLAARLMSEQEDFSDRWSTRGHVADRDRLLKRLRRHQRAHPRQRIALLSGDIHIGCAHRIDFGDSRMIQVISSGVTHGSRPLVQAASKLLIRTNWRFGTADGDLGGRFELLGADGPDRNPFGGLNVGIVEMTRKPAGGTHSRIYLYSHRGERPLCVYRSPPI